MDEVRPLPQWLPQRQEVVHLDPRRGLTGRTPCCNLRRHEIPARDRVTDDVDQVTCELMDEPPLINSIVEREAALSRRAGEALQRLLQVRVLIERASPQSIDAEFRNRLLKLIDSGQNGSE